jgi:hypothetical protein
MRGPHRFLVERTAQLHFRAALDERLDLARPLLGEGEAGLGEFGEQVFATPAVLDECIYLRTEKHLFAFGEAIGTR